MALASRRRPLGGGPVRRLARGDRRAGPRPDRAGRQRRAGRARRRPARPRAGPRRARRRGLAPRQRGDGGRAPPAARRPATSTASSWSGATRRSGWRPRCCRAAARAASIALSASTASALAAMRDGRAHGALVHGPAGRLPAPPEDALRVAPRALARRRGQPRPPRARSPTRPTRRPRRAARGRRFEPERVRRSGGGRGRVPAARTGRHRASRRRAARRLRRARRRDDGARRDRMELAFAPLEEHVAEVWVDARCARAPRRRRARASCCAPLPSRGRLGLVGGYDLVTLW